MPKIQANKVQRVNDTFVYTNGKLNGSMILLLCPYICSIYIVFYYRCKFVYITVCSIKK